MSEFKISVDKSELKKRKLFLAVPMYGGLCMPAQSLIETEDGIMTIKQIVESAYKGKVKSYSEKEGFIYSPVIGHFVRRNEEKKKWVRLVSSLTGTSRETIICSEDHECSFVSDVFNPVIEYKPARELPGNYIVMEPSSAVGRITNSLFNKEQLSVVLGTLLGDGSFTKQNALKMVHSDKQKKYAEYKAFLLGGSTKERIGGGYSPSLQTSVYVGANAQICKLRELMYSNGKKEIHSIVHMIDPISLAFWYMDDGYCVYDNRNRNWKPMVAISTDGFTKEENELLVKRLIDLGISSKVFQYKNYWRIKIEDHDAFFNMISPYIIDSMKYKIPDRFHSIQLKSINNDPLNFGLMKVEGLKEWKKCSQLYDITVEGTHNFVSNGFLVHNCHGSFSRGVADLSALCHHWEIPLQIYYLFNESLITRARNYCCDEFMRSEMTHMMFIDSDIGFKAESVLGMLAMMSDEADYDVLGGPYPKKCISWEKIKIAVDKGLADENPENLSKFVGDYVFNPANGTTSFSVNQPVQVLETGTGFMMIRKKTLEKYRDTYPSFMYRPDHVRTAHFDGKRMIMAYFDCAIDRGFGWDDVIPLLQSVANKTDDLDTLSRKAQALSDAMKTASARYLSEDYLFCQNVNKAGMKVWLCPWIELEHTGSYVFGGSLRDIAKLGTSPTADGELLDKFKGKK